MAPAKKAPAAKRRTAKRSGSAPATATSEAKVTVTHDSTKQNKDAAFYCPGCGRRFEIDEEPCTGPSVELPHPPIEVVSTKELYDGSDHTPAPNTEGV